ncbi:unnamed protein product [Trichobilharzia szidati]|nr:unnamed protein product [Trichobilharzia szidati]
MDYVQELVVSILKTMTIVVVVVVAAAAAAADDDDDDDDDDDGDDVNGGCGIHHLPYTLGLMIRLPMNCTVGLVLLTECLVIASY